MPVFIEGTMTSCLYLGSKFLKKECINEMKRTRRVGDQGKQLEAVQTKKVSERRRVFV